jgi:sodium pump decarboxylase gamma subunit
MEGSLLEQGATLMLVGMGTVFVFLTLLVVAVSAIKRFAGLFKEEEHVVAGIQPDEVAAITAAIAKHRGS